MDRHSRSGERVLATIVARPDHRDSTAKRSSTPASQRADTGGWRKSVCPSARIRDQISVAEPSKRVQNATRALPAESPTPRLGASHRFAEAWTLAAVLGPLLVAHAIGVTLRREPFDRKLGGVIGMMAGALALRTHLEGVWIAIAISGAVAGWGVAYGHVLQDCAGRFART